MDYDLETKLVWAENRIDDLEKESFVQSEAIHKLEERLDKLIKDTKHATSRERF